LLENEENLNFLKSISFYFTAFSFISFPFIHFSDKQIRRHGSSASYLYWYMRCHVPSQHLSRTKSHRDLQRMFDSPQTQSSGKKEICPDSTPTGL